MRRASWSLLIATCLLMALPPACFDTTLIEPTPLNEGGSPGSSGGTAAEAGQPEQQAGADNGGASPGGASPGGASPGGSSPGGSSAGGTAGSSATAGSAGQSSGGEPNGVAWLSLVGSDAPSSEQPNRSLQIAGRFYAYGDGCAELHWDETTRCASGQLCDALGGENWGIAVGFDFRTAGDDGAAPGAKLTWDPREVSALGVAYVVGGEERAPGLSLWVLNMDAGWDGECTAMTCEISGPPDGRRALPLQGELWFDSMVKEDWGGGGTYYEYDPAAVHALQFKLPAIEVGPASFDFCIDALGIIR